MMPRKKTHRKKNKKFLVGLVSLSTMAILTMNVSFADEDIQAKLQNWYETKTQAALKNIDLSVRTEVEVQKERLREEVQLKMKESSKDMDEFAEKQKQTHIEAVRNYSEQLMNKIQFSNEEEKNNLLKQLSEIQKNAEQEMLNVVNSPGTYKEKTATENNQQETDELPNNETKTEEKQATVTNEEPTEETSTMIQPSNQTVSETDVKKEGKPE
ncbi:hypothetical protein J7E38_06545 [Bacillus sp. ISL-35]|uniref:hypothetical protein n=1 Tax=Bacillus sp. ISL-35 TaxID=2819122 RepID=UPI001BE6A908|nr:hypothetical protein [Bacillus sp. ISL-35]MBT2678656.1 hypothetical protein [Bacillus sp. ISL-35]MBT2703648.1 hypothetical protein [Chryseobacterium sp. ISL-80]